MADIMKNTPQTYDNDEKLLLTKGEEFFLASKNNKYKLKKTKRNNGRIKIMKMHMDEESAETGVANTVVDASIEECAAYEFQSLYSKWWKHSSKDKGIIQLEHKKNSDHCVYYFTARNFGIPGLSTRQFRNKVIWKKQSNGIINISVTDTEEYLAQFPLNPDFVRGSIHTYWTFESLDSIGDIKQTAVTMISKVDFGGMVPTAIGNQAGIQFFNIALSALIDRFDKRKEIEAYINDSNETTSKVSR
jgi:hypothetical protein